MPDIYNWGTNLGSNCIKTLIYTTNAELARKEDTVEFDFSPLAPFKTFKIRQKFGFKKFRIFLA